MRRWPTLISLCLLAAVCLGPLPELARHSFSAHMALHMTMVAAIAPLLALGLAGGRFDPVPGAPALFSPFLASAIEFVVIWAWHVPALHQAARQSTTLFVLELTSYLAVGLLLWLAALGGVRRERAAAGIAGLLLTSMHMTLLGVLLALAGRSLYGHAGMGELAALQDQQIGGVIMLGFGGSIYLVGGLYLLAGLLRGEPTANPGFSEKRYDR
jgi:putative membrane protein